MATDNQYAKYVKLQVKSSVTNATGISADITLPSSITVPSGYINFYVGIGNYECGLSTTGNKWGWFANRSSGNTGVKEAGEYNLYENGTTHNITLQLLQESGSTYKLKFYIDGVHMHSSEIDLTSSSKWTNARLIIACSQGAYTLPLPAFNIRHNQVVIQNLKYRTGTNTWTKLTSNNCTPEYWANPDPADEETPTPVNYTVDSKSFSSGIYYASMK